MKFTKQRRAELKSWVSQWMPIPYPRVEEVIVELERKETILSKAMDALDQIQLGGVPYELENISERDVYDFTRLVIEKLKKEINNS
jgi:hypothetical protein